MKKRTKIFIVSFLLSLPFWWGINIFAEKIEYLLSQKELQIKLSEKIQSLTAEINFEKKLSENKPIRNTNISNLEINAKAGASILLKNNNSKFLFAKNENTKLPIASLAKLMTAIITLDNYEISKTIEISEKSALIDNEYGQGKLKISQELSIKNLLYLLLIESNNGAAHALANSMGEKEFMDKMNIISASLGLEKTFFVNPSGLDPDNISDLYNYSTVKDLSKLIIYSLDKHPLLWEILGIYETDLYLSNEIFYQQLKSTNELLEKIPQLGGKTGWTPMAQGCLIIVYPSPDNNGYLISIILGSENRFEDMKNLISWTKKAYRW